MTAGGGRDLLCSSRGQAITALVFLPDSWRLRGGALWKWPHRTARSELSLLREVRRLQPPTRPADSTAT